jgi:hypothetical protein
VVSWHLAASGEPRLSGIFLPTIFLSARAPTDGKAGPRIWHFASGQWRLGAHVEIRCLL